MVFGSRVEKKAAVDVVVWMFNVVILVGIIIINKVLMVKYEFSFGKYFILMFMDNVLYIILFMIWILVSILLLCVFL